MPTKDVKDIKIDQSKVDHPSHYTYSGLEVIDVIEAFKLNFHLGNVVKYVLRAPFKNGLEDLHKALWYLNREIERQTKLSKPVVAEPHWSASKDLVKLEKEEMDYLEKKGKK